MPIAAVPDYLQQALATGFKEASPGLRFGLYLPIWTTARDQRADIDKRASKRSDKARATRETLQQKGHAAARQQVERSGTRLDQKWQKSTAAGKQAWSSVAPLSGHDRQLNAALAERAEAMAQLASKHKQAFVRMDAVSTSPFTTGLGNQHPLENGFAFLKPYGLPCLAGSGVKGVLRQAARELASGDWGDAHGWNSGAHHEIHSGKKQWSLTTLELLFGTEPPDGRADADLFRGVLSFHDVLPHIAGDKLMVEVMTPHQAGYYQKDETPHDSGGPIPIQFLTVPPGSQFTFNVFCDRPRLRRVAPALANNGSWEELLRAAFAHAFDWLGFGAKTAVGYGAMAVDEAAERERAERAEQAQRQQAEQRKAAEHQAELARMSPARRLIAQAIDQKQPGQADDSAAVAAVEQSQLQGDDRLEAAGIVRDLMQETGTWREKSEKRRPERDKPYQRTLKVMSWLAQ